MAEAYIIDAIRTPIGRKKGGLATLHSADLGAHPIKALIEHTGIDPGAVDDVVYGCVDTIGSQAGDIARTCWLVAGLPDHVPGVTVDRQCGSAQQAIHFAAQLDVVGVPGGSGTGVLCHDHIVGQALVEFVEDAPATAMISSVGNLGALTPRAWPPSSRCSARRRRDAARTEEV